MSQEISVPTYWNPYPDETLSFNALPDKCPLHFLDYGLMTETIQDKVINGTVIESIKREVGFMPKNGERLSAEEILIIENWKENGAPNN